MAQALVW